jgi:hypothetical protein
MFTSMLAGSCQDPALGCSAKEEPGIFQSFEVWPNRRNVPLALGQYEQSAAANCGESQFKGSSPRRGVVEENGERRNLRGRQGNRFSLAGVKIRNGLENPRFGPRVFVNPARPLDFPRSWFTDSSKNDFMPHGRRNENFAEHSMNEVQPVDP